MSVVHDSLLNVRVCDMMLPGELRWDEDLVHDLFNVNDATLICRLPLSFNRRSDAWVWCFNDKGIYSVSSAFKLLKKPTDVINSEIWKLIWSLKSPPKMKNFLWRVARRVLSTCNNLNMRRIHVENLFLFCQGYPETDLHLFVDCLYAKKCWYAFTVGYFRGVAGDFNDWLLTVLKKGDDLYRGKVAAVLW